MRLFYITLNNDADARTLAHLLLSRRDAVCCNWFPISCAYVWDGEIKQGAETVLIAKSLESKREAIAAAVAETISYTNFVGEIELCAVNDGFAAWLTAVVGGI